jgi:hypothetical protein
MTSPLRKPVGARRGSRGNDKLILSLGSCNSPWGRPKDWPLVLRALFCYGTHFPWSPAGDGSSTIHRPPAIRLRLGCACPLPCFTPSSSAFCPSRKREGNEEGDQLEFVHLSKETIPPKDTSEVDEKLHPVSWYRPARPDRLPFRCRSQHGRTAGRGVAIRRPRDKSRSFLLPETTAFTRIARRERGCC